MTTLRTAAQQALEALIENARLLGATQAKKGFGCFSQEDARLERAWHEGIAKHSAALRAALAEPVQEPLTNTYVQVVPNKCDRIVWRGHYFHLPVNSTSEPVQEPVAWVLALPDGRLDRLSVVAYDDEAEEMLQRSIAGCTLVPLYAAPPQPPAEPVQEPSMWGSGDGYWVRHDDLHHRPDKYRFTIPLYTAPPK